MPLRRHPFPTVPRFVLSFALWFYLPSYGARKYPASCASPRWAFMMRFTADANPVAEPAYHSRRPLRTKPCFPGKAKKVSAALAKTAATG